MPRCAGNDNNPIPATYVARLLKGDAGGIGNVWIPAGQDPFGFAQGRLYGLNGGM
ncbi:MAG: hypothetical protein K8R02_08040 [Anaerohalosphaeraceae bacterium]|nr:hypothetical protein [Anaerohalosphaeraceae bacterium]